MATPRILVVDEDGPVREIMVAILNAAGYRCLPAASGKEALSVLQRAGECELALADLMTTRINGLDLLEHARQKYPDMELIVVSPAPTPSTPLRRHVRTGRRGRSPKPARRSPTTPANNLIRRLCVSPWKCRSGYGRTCAAV